MRWISECFSRAASVACRIARLLARPGGWCCWAASVASRAGSDRQIHPFERVVSSSLVDLVGVEPWDDRISGEREHGLSGCDRRPCLAGGRGSSRACRMRLMCSSAAVFMASSGLVLCRPKRFSGESTSIALRCSSQVSRLLNKHAASVEPRHRSAVPEAPSRH